MFARCWLLVEGESELLEFPDLARVCPMPTCRRRAGVRRLPGLESTVRHLAHHLGIAWHVMDDGTRPGRRLRQTVPALALGPAGLESPGDRPS